MTPLSRVLKAPHRNASPQVILPVRFAPMSAGDGLLLPVDDEPAGPPDRLEVLPPPAGSDPREDDQTVDSVEAELLEMRREAERMLVDAQAQVAGFLREAQERAQAIEAEARERGFRSGLEAAREAQRVLLADLEALRTEVQAERARYFENLEPEVVRLALAVAEKIIRQEVDLHPEIVVGVARAAIGQLKEAQSARIAAHPSDVEVLRQHLSEPAPGGPAEVTVYPSAHISRGGCQVDSDRGSADARLELQIERAAASLEGGEM